MAGFRLVQLEESTYSSPQEMYSDMKIVKFNHFMTTSRQ